MALVGKGPQCGLGFRLESDPGLPCPSFRLSLLTTSSEGEGLLCRFPKIRSYERFYGYVRVIEYLGRVLKN